MGRAADRTEREAPRQWGGVARRGVRKLHETSGGGAVEAWREAMRAARAEDDVDDVWIDEGPVEAEPDRTRPTSEETPGRSRPPRSGRRVPAGVRKELAGQVQPARAERLQERLSEAARAYERDRYPDALQLLRRLAEEAPGASAVRELLGLTYYRMGRWRDAVRELDAFRTQTGSFDQHPVLADAHRALQRWADVEELWEELREASPDAWLVAEGRIVAAGALADRGRLADAIALLEAARTSSKKPQPHHLRLWYALADLYERAGDVPRARDLFSRVARHDPELSDVKARVAALR